MNDKYALITDLGSKAQSASMEAFHVDAAELKKLFRSLMKSEELLLWDLASFWEEEALRCAQAEAHFSAMISAVAMNEALLCYLCLVHENEVRASQLFTRVVGGRKAASLSKLLGEWKLKTLLQFAFETEVGTKHINKFDEGQSSSGCTCRDAG